MANYKGSGIVFLRSQIKAAGPDKEEALMKSLSISDRSVWESTLSMSWIPVGIANTLWQAASQALFPNLSKDEAIFQCGSMQARSDINGMYRLIFRVVTTQTIIKRAAGLWRTFHQKGIAKVQTLSEKQYVFHVIDYPDLPEGISQSACGYIYGLVELAGKTNITIEKHKNQDGWDWFIKFT